MADFLTVAGHAIEIQAEGAVRRASAVIGETARAFSGALRSTVRAEKRSWDFRSAALTPTEAATILGLIAGGVYVDCSGSALDDATISCYVTARQATYNPSGVDHTVTLDLSLVEV